MNYLLDTNVIIYLLDGKLPAGTLVFMRSNIPQPIVSVISEIEAKGFPMPIVSEQLFDHFFNTAQILNLSRAVIDRTILLRKTYKIKTPDAIIAATAIEHDLVLLTRNTSDFAKISGLQTLDPFSI